MLPDDGNNKTFECTETIVEKLCLYVQHIAVLAILRGISAFGFKCFFTTDNLGLQYSR